MPEAASRDTMNRIAASIDGLYQMAGNAQLLLLAAVVAVVLAGVLLGRRW